MNKMELVEYVAAELEMPKATATKALEAVLEGITTAVSKGEEVRLVGFGSFVVSERAATKGRIPGTDKEIDIPASRNVRFKAGAALKEAVKKAS